MELTGAATAEPVTAQAKKNIRPDVETRMRPIVTLVLGRRPSWNELGAPDVEER